MAIIQTVVGSHHSIFTYDAGSSITDIINQTDPFIQSRGWQLYYSSANTVYVYRKLDFGGISTNDAHYTYAALKFIANGIMLEQWLLWSGSAGITKAQNLYVSSGTATTEALACQPLSLVNGGSLTLNVSDDRLYLLGVIPGKTGNSPFNGGTIICSKIRYLNGDIVGGSPDGIYIHVGGMFLQNSMLVSDYAWSTPKGIDGSISASRSTGTDSGFWCPTTTEYKGGWNNVFNATNVTVFINAPNFYSTETLAGAVHPISGGNSTQSQVLILGAIRNVVRKYAASAGDLITVKADAMGVPGAGADKTYIVVPGGIGIEI